MPLDTAEPRPQWSLENVEALFDLPFAELVFRAAQTHRRHFDPAEVQLSQLMSVKTGGCAEDCGYCSQSAHFDTGLAAGKLEPLDAGHRRGPARPRPAARNGSAWAPPGAN